MQSRNTETLISVLGAYTKKHLRWGAASTIKQYRVTIHNLARMLGHEPTTDDLTDDVVADAMEWFIRRGRTVRGANKLRSNLHTLWTFAARMGAVATWPDTRRMTEPERIPVAWTAAELQSLFGVLAQQRGTIAGLPARLWWVTLHSVMWDTEERVGAVISVPRDNISLSAGRIRFAAETRKGKRRDVEHRLHPDTVAAITAMWGPERKLLFPWCYEASYLWTKYRTIRRRAGLPADRLHSFHCMRRTGASFFEAAGGDATKLLDHSSREITRRHYLAPSITETQTIAPCDVLFRPWAPRVTPPPPESGAAT